MRITRTDLDLVKYNSKFALVDLYDKKPTGKLLHSIFVDPTTFMYKMFKIDGKPLKLFPYQDMIVNDGHRYIIFRAANQIGKSLLLDAKAARNLLIDHGHAHNEAIVSKSLPQSIFQMRRVKSLLNCMEKISWSDVKGDADSMSVISVDIKDSNGKIKYTNLLVCAPCTEGLLGYDLHELNLDEFEYWDTDIKHFFNQIAQPRTYSTKGNITIFSNPNGQDSFVADLEKQKRLNGEYKWHTYIFNYLDKPGNTQQEYNELKHELDRQSFESTVAAIRSISDRNWFTPDEIERSLDLKLRQLDMVGKQPFGFLDIGAKIDRSVFVMGWIDVKESGSDKYRPLYEIYIPIIHAYPAGYPLSRVVGAFDDGQDSDGWHVEKSVKEYLLEWGKDGTQPQFGCDVTGNSGIVPLFKTAGVNPIDVTFSGPAKSGMYQRFKYYMEKGLLHRIKHDLWRYEAGHLIMKKSVRGYLMVHAETEKDHDDCMDATAGLIHLTDNPDFITPGVTILG